MYNHLSVRMMGGQLLRAQALGSPDTPRPVHCHQDHQRGETLSVDLGVAGRKDRIPWNINPLFSTRSPPNWGSHSVTRQPGPRSEHGECGGRAGSLFWDLEGKLLM